MYDYIKGPVTRVTPEYIVVEVTGVGWQLNTPNPYAFHVSNEEIQVFNDNLKSIVEILEKVMNNQ